MLSVDQGGASTLEHPVFAYRDFLAAIVRQDVKRTLARMSPEYSQDLRAMLCEPNFLGFFSLWCGTYPEHIDLVACNVGRDQAIIETEGHIDGLAFSGYAILDRIGSKWHVSSETHGECGFPVFGEQQHRALQSMKRGRENGS
jgi:hypothetical protein